MRITHRLKVGLVLVCMLLGCSGYGHNIEVPFISYVQYPRKGDAILEYFIEHPAQQPYSYWCAKYVHGQLEHRRELTPGDIELLERAVPRQAPYQRRQRQAMYSLWAQTAREELIVEGWFETGRHQAFVDLLRATCDAKN